MHFVASRANSAVLARLLSVLGESFHGLRAGLVGLIQIKKLGLHEP
jgi:hypothetical protein